jgi:glycosyltransferase involved in cell wall biosynthesis
MDIAVLIPVYNGSKTLQRTLESIKSQTILNKEGVFVDVYLVFNGCDDNSKELSEEFFRKLETKNLNCIVKFSEKGIVPALNEGLMQARFSDFIARLDADDTWYPEKLEKQINFLAFNPDISVLGTQIQLVTPKEYRTISVSNYPITDTEIKQHLMVGHNPIAHPSVVFKPEIINRAGTYSDLFPLAEDFWLWCRVALCGYKFANLPEVLMDYTRTHNPKYTPLSPETAAHCYNVINNSFGVKADYK